MLIHITNGTYGFREDGFIKPKTRLDPPFEVEDAEAEHLAALGVAEIVRVAAGVPAGETDNAEGYGNIPVQESAAETGKKVPAVPSYSDANTVRELTAICEQYGVEIPARASKKQILEIMDLFFRDEEAPPVPSAAEPL